MNYKKLLLTYLEYVTKLTNNLPAEMAHSYLIFWWLLSLLGQFNSSRKLMNSSIFFYLIQRITNQNILGRFLLQLQVQMKTSLEVINMNATYVRSQHIVDFQRNAMPL